jgi:hypothetical protein
MSDRREAIFRKGKRAFLLSWEAMQDTRLSFEARGLLAMIISRPKDWQVVLPQIVASGQCGPKKLHRMMKELRDCGYGQLAPERDSKGHWVRGFYLFSDEPICSDFSQMADCCPAGGNGQRRGAAKGHPGKSRDSVTEQTIQQGADALTGETEPRRSAAKTDINSAERRSSGAKAHLPQAEPGESPAKGSAMKEAGSEPASPPAQGRITAQMRRQIVSAAGPCLADPRKTPALQVMGELVIWLTLHGYDWDEDILACIRAKAPGIADGQVYTWRYFAKAIGEWHRRRMGVVAARMPKLPPGMAAMGDLCQGVLNGLMGLGNGRGP